MIGLTLGASVLFASLAPSAMCFLQFETVVSLQR